MQQTEIRRGLLASGRVDYLASVLPTLRLCWFFLVFCAPSKKLRDLLPVVVCGPSKRRTDLRTRLSKAKYRQEADFDVKTSLAPPKSAENYEKPKKKSEKKFSPKNFFENFFSASKNRKLQIVRNAFCRSFALIRAMFAGFVAASAGFAKRKQCAGVLLPCVR